MERMLLTGGSGFIGRNLRESALAEEYEILAPSHTELELMDEDAVGEYLRRNRIDVIVHAACKPGHRNAKDPTGIFYHNTRIFCNLFRHRDDVRRLVITGSGAIYDMRHYIPKMREDYFDAHVPVDEHGMSKYVIERCIAAAPNVYDLRIFGVYGKYEDYQIRFISNMVCKSLFDLPLTVKQDKMFDYVHVRDLVPILGRALSTDLPHRSFNVTPDRASRLTDIARLVLDRSGKDLPILVATPGMGMEYSGDNALLRRMMPDLRFVTLEEGIDELIEYYASMKDKIDKSALLVDK